jgi:hypothetical protein
MKKETEKPSPPETNGIERPTADKAGKTEIERRPGQKLRNEYMKLV